MSEVRPFGVGSEAVSEVNRFLACEVRPLPSEKGIKPGQRCSKGRHVCAEPRCQGEHSLQQHATK